VPSGGKLRSRVLMGVALGGVLYLLFAVWADPGALATAFRGFTWSYLALALLLAGGNYLIRFAKWHFYLRVLRVEVPVRDSLLVFLCGLVMSITPGKLGELLKPYLLRQIAPTPMERSAPVVLAERLTDLISVLLLALIGIVSLGFDPRVAWVGGAMVIGLILLVSCRPLFVVLAGVPARVTRLAPLAEKALVARESMVDLIRPGPLLLTTALSVPAWFLECLAFQLILRGFGAEVPIVEATAVYAFATIAGAVTMLPGGLGATEASMAILLQRSLGVPMATAAAATLVVRIATLWFAVLIGAVAMVAGRRRFEAGPAE